MTDQIPSTNPVPTQSSILGTIKPYLNKIVQLIKPVWEKFKQTKFYTNKTIFYTLCGMFGLMFLIIIMGVLFGGPRKTVQQGPPPTPTPLVLQGAPSPTPGGDTLSQIGQKLSDIKSQIDSLDVKQSRLQPPPIDFKISF